MTDFRKEVLTDMAQSFSKVIAMTCKTDEEVDLVMKVMNRFYDMARVLRINDPYANVDITPDPSGKTTGDVNDK